MALQENSVRRVLEFPDTTPVKTRVEGLIRSVQELRIDNVDDHAAAQELLSWLTRAKREAQDLVKPTKRTAKQLHADICEMEHKLVDPIDRAIREVNGKLDEWDERARIAAEAAAKERERILRLQHDEQVQAEALEAAEAGDADLAEEILETGIADAPVVRPEPEIAKVKGVVGTERWVVEVVNAAQALRAIADHPEHLAAVEIKLGYFNRLASMQRGEFRFPGLRVSRKTTRQVRG